MSKKMEKVHTESEFVKSMQQKKPRHDVEKAVSKEDSLGYKSKWSDEFIWDVYDLAKEGMTEFAIAKVIGISKNTLIMWEKNKKHPQKKLFKRALEKGREIYRKKKQGGQNELEDYIYKRLSKKERKIWRKLVKLGKRHHGLDIAKKMLSSHGKIIRQHLFIHAMIHCTFKIMSACRMVGISYNTFVKWMKEDPDFPPMFKAIEEAKKDLVESSLLRLVKSADPVPTVHAAKALLTNDPYRGYTDKKQIDVNVSGTVNHNLVELDVAALPYELQTQLLDFVRKSKQIESREVTNLLPASNIIEAAVVEDK